MLPWALGSATPTLLGMCQGIQALAGWGTGVLWEWWGKDGKMSFDL